MATHENLWALAPEQADAVFSLYRDEMALRGESARAAASEPRADVRGPKDFAKAMTRREGGETVISVSGPLTWDGGPGPGWRARLNWSGN